MSKLYRAVVAQIQGDSGLKSMSDIVLDYSTRTYTDCITDDIDSDLVASLVESSSDFPKFKQKLSEALLAISFERHSDYIRRAVNSLDRTSTRFDGLIKRYHERKDSTWSLDTAVVAVKNHSRFREVLVDDEDIARQASGRSHETTSDAPGTISVRPRDAIVLSDQGITYNLGRPRFGLKISSTGHQAFVLPDPDDPKRMAVLTTTAGYFHPHVSGRILCLGDGTGPINTAIRKGDLRAGLEIVYSILKKHYARGAYQTLAQFKGRLSRCCLCGESMAYSVTDTASKLTCSSCMMLHIVTGKPLKRKKFYMYMYLPIEHDENIPDATYARDNVAI